MTFRTTAAALLLFGMALGACTEQPASLDGAVAVDAPVSMDAPPIDTFAGDTFRSDGAAPDAPAARDTPPLPSDAPPMDPLGGSPVAARLGGTFSFLEGPQWIEATGEFVFSDIPANTIHVVRTGGAIEILRMPSGNSNGLAIDGRGCLLAAEHSGRRVSVACPPTAAATTLVSMFEGSRLNSPNDLAVRSDGTIYFTDPPYGLTGPSALGFMGLFRITTDTTLVAEVRGPLSARPNGVVLSPDERVLYVSDSEADFVRAYDVATDGSLSLERAFIPSIPSPDGMAIDTAGNLFVAAGDGIRVYAPSGTAWGTIDIPMQPANCTFGGADHRTLLVTARTALYRVTLPIPGIP